MYKDIYQQWPEQAAQIIAANNSQPPLVLRVNGQQGNRAAYLAQLAQSGIKARPGLLSEQAIYLDEPQDVATLPGFEQGLVSGLPPGSCSFWMSRSPRPQLTAMPLRPAATIVPGAVAAPALPTGAAAHIFTRSPASML